MQFVQAAWSHFIRHAEGLRVERVVLNALRRSRSKPASWGQAAPPFKDSNPAVPACLALALLAGAVGRATAAETRPVESYPLQHYLTGLAEADWRARSASLAKITSARDVTERREFIRAEFLRAIGGLPTEKTPLNARVTGVLERSGYRIEKVIYESFPGCFVTANLYVPTTGPGPFPAVLGAAGHAMPEGKASPVYQSAFISLARRGYVVLAYDPPAQGERFELRDSATGEVRSLGHISPGLQCLLTGGTSARYFMWDGIRGLDYLLTRPEVDPARIAAAGNSGGGTQSAFLGVCEPRIAAVASSCYWTSWEALWHASGPQDSEQVLPNWIHRGLDFSDLALAFAPKPILMLTATKDAFPVAGARAMHAEAKPFFALLGAGEQLGYFEYNDGHAWSKPRREATVAWFDRWLYGRTEFVTEPAHTPEPVAALRCTETGHVLTAFASKTTQKLNEEVAQALHPRRTLARGLPAAEARRVIAARLALAETAPAASATVVRRESGEGHAIETIAFTPEPGLELPARLILPRGAAERRPAVLLVREDARTVSADDPAVAAWWRDGYVVALFAPRGLPVPEEKKTYYTLTYKTAMRALLVGRTIAGMRVQDLLALFRIVQARPDVAAGRISIAARGQLGVLALYAAALEPRLDHALVEQALVSYQDLVRSPQCPESYADIIVPGALLDFDLPDLVTQAGAERVRLVDPVAADGTRLSEVQARASLGAAARLVLGASGSGPALLR